MKCNTRNSISNKACSSPNVPYERFEKLLIASVIENVFTEDRVKTIIQDCRDNADRLAGTQGTEREQITKLVVAIERKLNNLYKLIEEDQIRRDASLSKRITTWQDELEVLTAKLNSVKVPVVLPRNIIEQLMLPVFAPPQ